jgi:hypothetical protein
MKKEVASGLARVGLLVVFALVALSAPAKAQSLQYKLNANIPFEFSIADKKFPAGNYSFSRAQVNSGDLVIQISSKDGHSNITRLTIPTMRRTSEDESTVVFHRYGNEYFLFQVWAGGATTGRALIMSRSERDLWKAQDNVVIAPATPKQEIVVVAADLP